MPQIRFPAGYPLPQSQAALLPNPDDLEGFDPNSVNAGDPTPIPPSPDSAAQAQEANSVALPPLDKGGKPKKFKLPPSRNGSMPPPDDLGPAPQESAPPEAPSPAAAAAAPTSPPTGPPPPDIGESIDDSKHVDSRSASEKLASLQPPEAPHSNWAQRLGLAVLSATKLAPAANMLIHPKWSEQARAYQATKADLESKQQDEIKQGEADATEAQKQAVADWRHAQAEPHRNQQEIDPQYAKENMPWLRPDASGQYWVDKAIANTLSKPEKAAALHVVPAGSSVVDENGKLLFSAPEKEEKQTGAFEKDFLPGWAAEHGVTGKPTAVQTKQALTDFNASQADKDPEMRAARLASMQTAELLKQMQLNQQPTPEQAVQVAQDIVSHHVSPEQMSQMFGGFGATGQAFKRMVYGEAKKLDPNFDFEQASADYSYSKSPAFQNTVRMMDSATNSMGRLQQSANALANGKVRSINALINMGKNQFNSVDLKKFQTDALLVGDEVGKVIQGGGTGSGVSDAKLRQAQDLFKSSDDPAVIASAISEVSQILNYRRKAVARGTYMEHVPAMIPETGDKPSGVEVHLKSGKTATFSDQKVADAFRKDHPDRVQ